jgi:fructose-1,6-bisphosphatase II / sedoheptulose-1,7-bisphosphatase
MLNRMLTIEIARVTEAAAIAAARWRGRGDEKAADQAAVDAMRQALNQIMLVDGLVVIGEGERDQAPVLYIGEKVGGGGSQNTDIALDPLEGTTLCAKAMPNAIAVVAMADAGSLLHAPDTYMDKIAVGGAYPEGVVDLDRRPEENIEALAHAKGVRPNDIAACILDRPRHAELIEAVRSTGAAVHLITDGDVAGVIHTTNPEETGIDIYMGIGGAPEGVLAAAALRCTGGQMQGRLMAKNAEQKARAMKRGVADFERKLMLQDMASGDVIFAATGVTD